MKRAAYLAILYSALITSSGVVVKLGGSSGTPMALLCVLVPYAYLLLIALFSQRQVVARAIVVASVLVCISGLISYLTLYQRTQSMAGLIFFFVPMAQIGVLFVATLVLWVVTLSFRSIKTAERPVEQRDSRAGRAAKQPPDGS